MALWWLILNRVFGTGKEKVKCLPVCTAEFSVSYACTYCRPGWPSQACSVLPDQARWSAPQSVRKRQKGRFYFIFHEITFQVFAVLHEFSNYFLSMHSTGQEQMSSAFIWPKQEKLTFCKNAKCSWNCSVYYSALQFNNTMTSIFWRPLKYIYE